VRPPDGTAVEYARIADLISHWQLVHQGYDQWHVAGFVSICGAKPSCTYTHQTSIIRRMATSKYKHAAAKAVLTKS
jgi:hypothetical protein